MARPRSDERRSAIMAAAARVIASQGLGAATATIAKEAGVSNGSLFTYFETKAELLNQLYLELKTDMAEAALEGLPSGSDVRGQLRHMWTRWLNLAVSSPDKARAFALLDVSDDITPQTRQAGHLAMAGVAVLLERSRENGPMREAPHALIVALMNTMAATTVDFMIRDPAHAERHNQTMFDALWRMLA